MIKVILCIAGSYYAARSIRNVWLAMPVAIVLSLVSNIVVTIVLTQTLPEVSEEAIYGMVAGLVWYPVIAIVSFVVFRIGKKKEEAPGFVTLKDRNGNQPVEKNHSVRLNMNKKPVTHKPKDSSSRQQGKERCSFCTQCGIEAGLSDKFCGNCGVMLEEKKSFAAAGLDSKQKIDDKLDFNNDTIDAHVRKSDPEHLDKFMINTKPKGMEIIIDGLRVNGTTPIEIKRPKSPFEIDFIYNNKIIATKKYNLSNNESSIFVDFTEQLLKYFDFHPGVRKCLKCNDEFMALNNIKCQKCGESILTVPV